MYKLKTPQAPLALTTLGLVPFLAAGGSMVAWRVDADWQAANPIFPQIAGLWLLVYGALILSFLGGVRWGAEMTRRDKPRFGELLLSILGVIIGWALTIAYFQWQPDRILLIGMAAALSLHYLVDLMSGEMPLWYRKLRLWPTIGAVLSLIAGYWSFSGA